MPGTIRVAQPCGCVQETYMGQRREKFCECGNLFEKPEVVERRRDRRSTSTLKPGRGMAASPAQREKVAGAVCVGCGAEATPDGALVIDPAHVWPRGKGGCDSPDCVLPLCRFVFDGSGCHRLFDEGQLDLLSRVSEQPEAFATELAHPIRHHGVPLVSLVQRLAGNEYRFVKAESPRAREAA